MKYSLFFRAQIIIATLFLFVFASCDSNCNEGECPSDQVFLDFKVIDHANRNCAIINPDFEAIILSSNDINQDEVVVVRNGELNLIIQPDNPEYLLKYNQIDLKTLELTAITMPFNCCGSNIDVLEEYGLIDIFTKDTICKNCIEFQLLVPSCD